MKSAMQQHTSMHHRQRSYRRLRLLGIPLVLFMFWAMITIWNQYGMIQEKRIVLEQIETQLVDLKNQNEGSKKEMIRLYDKEYLEQKIRKELNYIKPGETIFYVPKLTE